MAVAKLPDDAIANALRALPGWTRHGDAIEKQYTLADFRAALDFVNRVGELAEAADHHPDITINYKRVTLRLSTHEAGGLTERDVNLAKQIESLG
jgi:4a-hydroxytetrahydrobiopterin dehydratase